MTDIVERLNEQHDVYAKAREEYRKVIQQQRDEIEKLRWENANMEKLWGKSEGTWMEIRDKQDAEIERLREALQNIASKNPFHNQCPPAGDTNYYGKLIAEMVVIANAALKEKE